MVAPIVKMPNSEKHSGMSGIPTQLMVLHSGESPLRGGYAQSLTEWANIPLAQGGPQASWHWFVDPIAIVSMVDVNLAAWHASEANPMSEGFEQSGYARFSRNEWLTDEGRKQMDNLAWIMAQRAKATGCPPVWLTTDQVNAITSGRDRSTKGFCIHAQIDPDMRTDPGQNFPYDMLMDAIKVYMGVKQEQDEYMPSAQWFTDVINAVHAINVRTDKIDKRIPVGSWFTDVVGAIARLDQQRVAITAIYNRVFGRDVQRWYDPKTLEVAFEKKAAHWLPARSTDVHDVISSNKLIQNGFALVLDTMSKTPGIDQAVIDDLAKQLSDKFAENTKNLEITFTTAPALELEPPLVDLGEALKPVEETPLAVEAPASK